MKPIKPIIKNFGQPEHYPFLLAYRSEKTPESELPGHIQEWYEIVYIYSGKGTFFIDNTFYDMGPGDLFIVPTHTIHHAIPERQHPIRVSALYFHAGMLQKEWSDDAFSFLQLFQYARKSRQYKITLEKTQQTVIEKQIELIQDEFVHRQKGYKTASVLHLRMTLLMLDRIVQDNYADPAPAFEAGPKWMIEALKKLDQSSHLRWSLADLARQANVDPAHFSRVFKHLTGMNISQYMTWKRIIKAKQLLLATDNTIPVIADTCGFASVPHFHRMFKKWVGMTPHSYRKQQRRTPFMPG